MTTTERTCGNCKHHCYNDALEYHVCSKSDDTTVAQDWDETCPRHRYLPVMHGVTGGE